MGQISMTPAHPPPLSTVFSPEATVEYLSLQNQETPRSLITSLPPDVPPRAVHRVLTWATVPRRKGVRARHKAALGPTLPAPDVQSG